MWPLILLLGLLPLTSMAQFSGLSTSRDGGTVYFSSALRFRGSPGNADARLFRIANGSTALFRSQQPGRSFGRYNEFFHNLIAPQVSGDGSVIAFTGTRPCSGGSGCVAVQRTQGTLTDPTGRVLLSRFGNVNISPNGQYALFFARDTFASLVTPTELVDLSTGATTQIPLAIPASAGRSVANDGTVAIALQGGIRLWNASDHHVITNLSIGSGSTLTSPLLMIGADGRRLVYQTPFGLARFDRQSAIEQIIARRVPLSTSIDENASLIAYVDPADLQIYVAPEARQLTREPEGMAEVALSGDGRIAFAVTKAGRILQIEVATGAVTELIPRTPNITTPIGAPSMRASSNEIVPGSLIPLAGSGLATSSGSAVPPLPQTLNDVQVRIDGVPARIQSVSPELVWIQVPWGLREQENAPFEFLSGDSPFAAGPETVQIHTRRPNAFFTQDAMRRFVYTAIHQDWSRLVTEASPALPGEIITIYFHGLGPVTPQVPTGQASPSNPPAVLTVPLRCQFLDQTAIDARIHFAGLAPGMVGIYQASLEVPRTLRRSDASLSCDVGSSPGLSINGTVFVAAP